MYCFSQVRAIWPLSERGASVLALLSSDVTLLRLLGTPWAEALPTVLFGCCWHRWSHSHAFFQLHDEHTVDIAQQIFVVQLCVRVNKVACAFWNWGFYDLHRSVSFVTIGVINGKRCLMATPTCSIVNWKEVSWRVVFKCSNLRYLFVEAHVVWKCAGKVEQFEIPTK